jgi:DNA-binding FrmR family transcriptional regulator
MAIMKTSEQRINNIIGQLEGAKKMLSVPGDDCLKIIVQLKATRSAISSLMNKIIVEEMDECLLGKKRQPEKIAKIFKEIINQ